MYFSHSQGGVYCDKVGAYLFTEFGHILVRCSTGDGGESLEGHYIKYVLAGNFSYPGS